MADDNKAVDLTKRTFAALDRLDIATIAILSVQHQQIPNPPLKPGEVSINPVRYRYFVELRSGDLVRNFRVEGGEVYQQ